MKNTHLQFLAVSIGALLLVAKFGAYFLTNSTTVLTDALESIINVVAGALGLYSLILAARPKDENHPYGHGKVEFISAGVEGTLITLAGLTIIVQAVWSLVQGGQSLQQLNIGIYVTSFAGLVNYLMGWAMVRQGRNSSSVALVASGKHLKSDAYSTLGMVFGLILIFMLHSFWGMGDWAQIVDNGVAIIFGGIIGSTGYGLLRESVAGIMDEVDYPLVENLVEVLNEERHPNWIDVHNLRVIKYGSDLHIDCHLTVPWYFNAREAHDEIDRLEAVFEKEVASPVELFVHVDPCVIESCSLCQKQSCPVRQAEFAGLIEWELDNIMLNKKHGLEANH